MEDNANALDGVVPKATYYLGNSTFTVYEEMANQLDEAGWERRGESTLMQCDLILGDRFQIPYASLRCEPMAKNSFFGATRWVNYFEGSKELTLKAHMAPLLRDNDSTSSSWMPESYVLGGVQARKPDERHRLIAAAVGAPEAVWIVKPSSGAKGKKIRLLHGPDEVEGFVESLKPTVKSAYVAQRYVERPLLVSHGRKFDVRVWVMLQSPYTISVFTQGSCRTASMPFSMEDITNAHVHLTNHCLQEDAEHFGRYEEGNELWFSQLQSYLDTVGSPTTALEEVVLPQMSNIIVRSLLAVKEIIETAETEPYHSFQLFGYDMIVEDDFRVQLLEINGSPGIATRFLQTIVRSMCEQLRLFGESSPAPSLSREWNIKKEAFVLLWEEGDPIPEGLHGSVAHSFTWDCAKLP